MTELRSKKEGKRFIRLWGWIALFLLLLLSLSYLTNQQLPEGLAFRGDLHPAVQLRFLQDTSYLDENGVKQHDQQIFDEALAMIGKAERFVLADMFLFNSFQGQESSPPLRALTEELTQALLTRKTEIPALDVVFITDPINTLYGGLDSPWLDALQEAGVETVLTDLQQLPDSNPLYSFFWRYLIRPFGNVKAETLSNPFGEGRVSLRSWMSLLNFKANHRKVLITDDGDQWMALVTSANPHDGSAAHSNIALQFAGKPVIDLLHSEMSVPGLASSERLIFKSSEQLAADPSTQIQVLTEGAIRREVLDAIDASEAGDSICLLMFYLSDRGVVRALIDAADRGVDVRILLDPNKDAFGRTKNGIPNRPVATELHRAGVKVRWCDTHGEQCHGKMLLVKVAAGEQRLILGSANFTRRNLNNFNMESNVQVIGSESSAALNDASELFDALWENKNGRYFSVAYAVYADESYWKNIVYRVMEATGLSTF